MRNGWKAGDGRNHSASAELVRLSETGDSGNSCSGKDLDFLRRAFASNSVYEDKIYVWNDGKMPASLASTEKLFQKHSSKPYNPKLANVFFKSGMIEAWGRGFDKIREACQKYNGPLPEYEMNEEGIMVTLEQETEIFFLE